MAKKSLKSRAEKARAGAVAKAPLYDKRQANRISLWIVIVVAVLFGLYIGVELSIDPVELGADGFKVRSLFGFSVRFADIRQLDLEKQAVPARSRIVGNDAFGLFREGTYSVDGLGEAHVYLRKPNVSYLSIRADDKSYAISLGSLEKDQNLYDRIKLGLASLH